MRKLHLWGKTPIYNSETLVVHQDRSTHSMVLVWNKTPSFEVFTEELTHVLELYKDYQGNWITDATLSQAIDLQSQIWMEEVWMPQLLEQGIKRMATIIPKQKYLKLKSTDPSKPYGENEFTTAFFYSDTDARNWVRKEGLKHSA